MKELPEFALYVIDHFTASGKHHTAKFAAVLKQLSRPPFSFFKNRSAEEV